jgi:hypothetical protein
MPKLSMVAVYFFASLLGLSALLVPGPEAFAYYGRHSTEALLTFSGEADLPLAGVGTAAELNRAGIRRDRALAALDGQIQHLMGTFQSETFREQFGWPGVLGESYDIRFTAAEPGIEPGRRRLSYVFKGKVVFQKEAFSGHASRKLSLWLPLAPDRFYAMGMTHGHNACTDHHYNSEGDFWYFWDPELAGCPLRGNREDVLYLPASLERLPSTQVTYPEYDRLYGDNGNGDELEIAVFLGYINDLDGAGDLQDPARGDYGAKALKFVENSLRERGFRLKGGRDAFREHADGKVYPGINFFRLYENEVGGVKTRVRLLLSDTNVASKDATFHRHVKRALEQSDIVVYDGHSGLGANLDLRSIGGPVLDPKKYQIFYFNGCSSYPYFNGEYLKAKGGSRNLEIVLSGLPTYVDSAGPNVTAFLAPFLEGKTLSYQAMLRLIEASNGEENGTYLTGVIGDEDNRWQK